ncbi:transcriptional regulator LysR family [Vibrio variabilis]|uniref:Transcriptional regulator LysR family n=1 Tax=Vibrio variabilis TaxID=990271 RepID=A0ABQ0JJT5_9VIBR|nr:transcriptional regulator LysR family [Vibrio variabilis]
MLGSFLQRYPEIQLDLIESDSYSNLIDSRCDVAIRASSSLEDSSLHAIQFAHFTDCLCATPEYLAANSHPTTIEDLLKLDWITHEVVHGTKQITLTSPKGQVTKVNKEPRIVVRNTHSLKALVKNNLGFGILPTFVIQKELSSGSLLRLLPEIHSKPIPLYAVYQSKMHMPKRVRLLLDYLKTTKWSDETRGQK